MKRHSLLYLLLFILLFFSEASHAQNTGAYLIPRTVYVGDPAVLVFPLPELSASTAPGSNADIVLAPGAPNFPTDTDIDFHRIVLERRTSGSRLLIEFTAFVPGLLELPIIEIGGERITGACAGISSIIDPGKSGLELSGPAPSLAIPGTALMIYGTMAVIAFLIVLTLWFLLKGRRYLNSWIAKWKRWNLFISVKVMEKRLYKALLKGGNTREILDKLSGEFRTFLSFFTGNNCRAMTANELERLSPEFDCIFLGSFFRRCDKFRFSGGSVSTDDVFRLLADLRVFVGTLEKPKRELA